MTHEAPSCPYRGLAPPPELREHLLCGWTVGPHSGGTETVLPDGSIDLVWREGHAPILAGPDTGPVPSDRPPGSTMVGVSFRPGAAPAMLGIPADELRDRRVPLAEVWGGAERLEQGLDDGRAPSARMRLIEEALRRRLKRAERPDRLVVEAVARLRAPGPRRVGALGDELGISERHLRRRFNAAVGYGPKTLARVLRFQRMLALARRGTSRDLGQLAVDSGYADQAHMTAECTRLAGAPPARLFAERYLLPTTA
jgi:methylphosphotriester-DNA--protein-cysteine methyltransferase